jgi:hypothetical protein
VSWETARRLCDESGGHLVCIETRNEKELMVKLARGRALWLGLVNDGEGHWSWVNNGNFFFNTGRSASRAPHCLPPTRTCRPLPNGAWKTLHGPSGKMHWRNGRLGARMAGPLQLITANSDQAQCRLHQAISREKYFSQSIVRDSSGLSLGESPRKTIRRDHQQ